MRWREVTFQAIEDLFNRAGILTGDTPDTQDNGETWVDGLRFILGAGSQDVGSSLETVTTGGGRAQTQDANNPPDSRCINGIDALNTEHKMTLTGRLNSGSTAARLLCGKVRWDNDRSGYMFHFVHNALNLYRVDAGSITTLASQSYASGFQGGKDHTLVFTASGTTITVDLNSGETTLEATSQSNHSDHTGVAMAIRQDAGSVGDTYWDSILVEQP